MRSRAPWIALRPDHARLFFALWPPRRVRGELARRQRQLALDARPVAAGNLHITLAFLGAVEISRLPELRSIGGRLAPPECNLRLDRVGCFRHARVAWLGPSGQCEPLKRLQHALVAALREAGFALEHRRWQPHVTLYRDLRRPCGNLRVRPVIWAVRGFALMRSELTRTGPVYTVQGQWPAPE